ncbi:hypothetical protein PF011_g19094 [Phytophthora fragariae]|uniref:EF-hand domain-containing protein n=1 Tax=Phytophthora fragariae TaxID=53985 RepID=A0A6A3J452_9STRA|nr:hypothetical protein PF011_g19094 [Phytophthora fragariae]
MVARARQASAASRATSSAVSSPSSSSFEDSFASSESDASGSEFSTDSEAQSVRRVRASPVSRRRWRKSQNPSASSTALLPPAEPASTSLWTTREKQFEKFRSSLLSMPVPDGVGRVEKAKGYSLHVMSVMNWVLPDSTLHTSAIPASSGANESEEDEEEPLVTLGVHVSLFHATSKRFFGNTWVSPELAVDPFHIKQARHPKDGTLRYVIESAPLNFRAYFISDIIDSNCVGVLELVAYEKDPDSKATTRVVGCGWTLLPLFARQQPVQSGVKDEPSSLPSAFSLNTSGDSVSVFTGSPRALWELNPDTWSAQEKHEGCKFYYQLVQYEPMMTIAMLLRKNELVGALDPIPGLRNRNLANIDMGKNPKMLLHEEADTTYEETLASFVKIASLVPKSVQVEEPFELNVVATRVAINLRDEIEANLVARLRISRKAIHEGAASVEGEVSARVLKLALHNGRCFRTRQFTVPLKADPNGGDTLLCVRNHSKLRGFVFHPNMAIVVVLQYTVHFRVIWPSKLKQQALEAKKPPLPEEDVVLVTMGARALVPSDGKKLYLYDKHHHATAVSAEPLTTLGGVLLQEQEDHRRVLHVDLLSGAACRPYSDNTLYTPPDQVTRSLQNREPSAKDSFAFCDLKITIDEPPVEEETTAPASPVKPAIDECNQTNDDNDDCAADQWARKLLGKANSNPVLAQTLNALATSPTAKDKPADPPPRTPSPKKNQQVERGADPTTFVPDAPTSELSRASKTLLTRYGYMESHDKPPSSPTTNQKDHDKRKKPKKVELIAKSIETEVKDPLTANEIRFHFAAYRAYSPGVEMKTGMACSSSPARVYLTFQFYNFPPTRTETLRLSKAFDNGAGGEIQTFLLMRDTTANKPSLAIQFDVDTTSTMNPLETRRFAEYLKWNNLYVDVWDADSLFQLGTFAIPLHELLRQGSSVKKFQAEIEIAPPLGGTLLPDNTGDDEGGAICTVPDTNSGASSPSIGRVQLLMSSYGLKGENYIDQQPSNQAGAVQSAAPNEGQEGQTRKLKHRVRARTLVESNPELYRLLAQEGFYGDRTGKELRERRESQPIQRKGPGAVNTLTPKEITVLCELFGSRKTASGASSSAGNRPTRIKCDLEGRTGLLAVLSLKPSEAPAPVAAPVANPAEDKPVAVVESVEVPEVQQKQEPQSSASTSGHAQRLKRVLNIATKNQLALADAFALFDSNHDGFLSRDKFIKALRSLGTVFADLSDDDLALLADLLDKNKDGNVTYQELSQFLEKPSRMPKAEWRDHIKRIIVRAMEKGIRVHHIFVEIDASGDGKLSYEEFERGLNQLGVSTSNDKESVHELLAELDKDHDGTISYVEFLESLGISVEDNKKEVVLETIKDIKADVHEILRRLAKKGIKFEDVFLHFDTDRNGTLSVEEFTQALHQLLQLNANSGDTLKEFERNAVEEYVKTINSDGDTKIDYCEFLVACGVSGKYMQEKTANFRQEALDKAERKLIKLIVRARASGVTVREVFDQFDSNSDGNISLAEFQFFMEKLFVGQGMAGDDAALVAARFDTNRDGMISRREFQEFGVDLQKKFESLSSVFTPHLRSLCNLDASSKLAGQKWESFCQEEVGLSSQSFRTDVMPLISYFGFVDEGGDIELSALVKIVQSANPSVKPPSKDTALARLRTLLVKAKERGVDLGKSFAHFDADKDGEITRSELKDGLVALGLFKDMENEDFDSLLEQLDGDGSGKIDFSEFRSLLLVNEGNDHTPPSKDYREELVGKLKTLMEKAVEKSVSIDACFAHFDKDGDGKIKKEEFLAAMTELGFAADGSVIEGVIKLLDHDGSETISLSEFRQLFPAASTPSSKASSPKASEDNAAEKIPDCETKPTAPDNKNSPRVEAEEEGGVSKAKQSPKEDIDASGVKPGPADQTLSAPKTSKEEGESTHPEGEGGDRASSTTAPVENKQHQRLVRSTSFKKEKDLESTGAAGAPFRRTLTDPKAVGKPEHEGSDNSKTTPLRVSFAAVRAAKRAEMATSETPKSEDGAIANDISLSEQVSDGLAKLKKLLLTAAGKGVAVQQSFNHFDKEANGVLSYDQFVIGLRELGPDFANLSDDDILAMAKWLDGKQQHALRVEDFVMFVETPVVEEAPAVAENPVESLKSEDLTPTTPSDSKPAPVATSKRPPPLRRSGSSRIPAKKPPRPLTGTQSARAVTETAGSASTVAQDKPTGAREAADKVEGMVEPVPAPERTEQVSKFEDGAGTPPQGSTPRDPQDQTGGAAHLDCNYTFSSNPEIRAVELKLRQTALDAYERGILPLRVVSKFLECADDRRGQVPGGRGRSSKTRSELLRVEFLQVLMELGFTLLSDKSVDEVDAGAGGGMVKPVTKMNDHLYARQLERLARYRQHVKSDEAKAHKQLVRAVSKSKQYQQRGRQQGEDSLRRFEEEKKQLLRVLSYYRDGHKKSLVYSLLRQQVTTSLTLFPSFGDLLFFELPFMNPYDHHDRFRIELLLPSSREIAVVLDLEIVRSSEEWAFYRANLPLAYGFASSSADIEDEMIDDHDEVVMDSHDQLHIPLRLRWLDTSDSFMRAQRSEPGKKTSTIPVSMVIKSCSHGHTVALFNLELQPQPFACRRVLRFSHPASSIWRWKLRYPRGKFVVCMDPSVAMESLRSGQDEANSSGLVSFKCRVGDYPALESFFVVLYDDKFYARVFEVWQVRIQSKLRVDVHAVLGQSVRHELVIKGDGGSSSEAEAARRRVMCFTPMQHRGLVQFRPGQVFALVPQAFNRIEFAFCAVESAAASQLVVLVNLVDVDTHELVGAWSVHVTLALPVITKTYELRLPVGRAAQKKISYSNPWDQPQTIVLRSSAPTLLVPREPVLQLPSNGQAFLRLAFAARDHSAAAAEDVYLFINDKRTDQNEECLLFQVTYE